MFYSSSVESHLLSLSPSVKPIRQRRFFRALVLTPSQKDSQHSRPEESRWSGSAMNYKWLFICPLRGFDFPVEYRRVNQEVLNWPKSPTFYVLGRGAGSHVFSFFVSRRHRCPLFFFLILFFAFRIFFSCFFCDVFLVIPVQIRFQSNGSDIGLARPPIEPLTGTERVDVFLRFLCSDLFFSPTEKAFVWCVLLLWCLPERIPRAVIYTLKCTVSVWQFPVCCFYAFWE